jgi:hypothetical protein
MPVCTREKGGTMGDKGKGKDTGKGGTKKPKAVKEGRRPHELRQREAQLKSAP